MTLARLLAAALILCCLPASAQDHQPQNSLPSTGSITVHSRKSQGNISNREIFFSYLSRPTAAAPAEPWRIFPDRTADVRPGYNALDPSRLDQYRFDQIKSDPQVRHLKLDTLDADTTCYAIRSYVVARDSKDSDSTHAVSYSTCQPSNRYQVRTTELRSTPGDR